MFIFKIAIIKLLRETLGFSPAEWVDNVNSAIESLNPNKYQEKFSLNRGYIYTEAMELLPSLTSKRLILLFFHLSKLIVF